MLKVSENILFSTDLYGNNVPDVNKWWYYRLGHGHHISFYNIQTLDFIAKKYNLNLYTNGKTIGGATASGLNNLNSKTKAYDIFNYALKKYKYEKIIINIGEVDTEYVFWYKNMKTQIER